MRLAILLALAGGCGGDPVYTDGPIPVESVCSVIVDDLCRVLIECRGADYRDLDHCRADQICRGGDDLLAEVEMGWLRYDPAAAEACHERFELDPCAFDFSFVVPTVQEILARCDGVIAGLQPAGGMCARDVDCAEGFCARARGACGGACMAFAGEGASCSFELARCESELRCVGRVCRPPFVAGDPCDETGFSACFNDGFWCDLEAGVCRERVGEGETCNRADGQWCRDGLSCVATTIFDDGTCLGESAEGGPCSDERDCEDGLACPHAPGMLGTCTPPADAGGPCQIDADCQPGLECSGGACVQAPAIGERCERRCAGDALCDGVCKAPRYPGEACDSASRCVEGLCDGGVCRTRAPLGASCALSWECASRSCESRSCTDSASCL